MRSGESGGSYGAVVAGMDNTVSRDGASGGTVLDELAALGPFFASARIRLAPRPSCRGTRSAN